MDSCVNQQSCYVITPDQGGGAELCGSLASGTFSYLLVIVERECLCEKKWHKMNPTEKSFFLQLLYGFKLLHFVHWFQKCFCFRSTTFPPDVSRYYKLLYILITMAPKFDLVITFDWGGAIDLRSAGLNCF